MKNFDNRQSVFTINSRKFDGKIHRSWEANLLSRKNGLSEFYGVFDTDVSHPELGFIKNGTISHEFYWENKGYNVFRFHEPRGEFRNFYCNIIVPPEIKESVVDYIDLDIDVLVDRSFSVKVLDRDEFEMNSKLFGYPDEVLKNAESDLAEILEMIESRRFPFNFKE